MSFRTIINKPPLRPQGRVLARVWDLRITNPGYMVAILIYIMIG